MGINPYLYKNGQYKIHCFHYVIDDADRMQEFVSMA